jgi:alkaline phosphatase D
VGRFSRRRLLQGGAASALAVWSARLLPGVDGALALDAAPFEYGVASGDPLPDRVVIWTRVTARGPVHVRWEVARDAGFSVLAGKGTLTTDASRDHTVKVDVGGLSPGATYWYRFRALGRTSPVGRTRTAPVGSPSTVSLALVSCHDYQVGYYAGWRRIAERAAHPSTDLDFVLFTGDYIYEYGYDPADRYTIRTHQPTHETLTLADYRARYRTYRSDPDLRAAHSAYPFIAVWDDHEVANDRWSGGAENHQPDEGSYAARVAAAYQAYREWMPIRPDPLAEPIYRRFAWGDLVDLFALDTRTYRSQQVGGFFVPNTSPEINNPDRTLLGPDQRSWFKSGLAGSTAAWRLVGNQVMVSHLNYASIPDEFAEPLAELTGIPRDGVSANGDQWDGYQPERRDLLEHIRDHTPRDVGPSVTSINLNEFTGTPPRTSSLVLEQYARVANPHVRYVEVDSNGYVVVTVTPGAVRGDWYHLSDVHDPAATQRRAASYAVARGDARLREVG